MLMRRAQLIGPAHKEIFTKMIRDGRAQIMLARRDIVALRLGLLSHAFVDGSALRPCPAPVFPAFDAARHALKVVIIDAIRDKARRPVFDFSLHLFISGHRLFLSNEKLYAFESVPPR